MQEKILFDRIIVGAGFAGLSAGYHLGKTGERILLLEQGSGKEGASYASTAEMNHDPDVDWELVIKTHGLELAQEIWKLTERSIQLLTAFAHRSGEEHFETKRVPAYLFSTTTAGVSTLEHKLEMYKKIGADVSLVSSPERLHPSFRGALLLEGDGRTNSQAILRTLRRAFRRQGGTVKMHTNVDVVHFEKNSVSVRTGDDHVYAAKHLHVATGNVNVEGVPPLPIESHRTFVRKYKKHNMPQLFRSAVMWDVAEPFHYIRSFAGNDLWVGGEDMMESEVTSTKEAAAFSRVDTFARTVLGVDDSYARHGQWSGTFFPSNRTLPYIGDHHSLPLSYSVGFGGSGLLTSFVSGYLHARWKEQHDTSLKQLFAL